jgi:hypothetical protein
VPVPSFTIRVGILLVIFGVTSYVTTGGVSLTALIPSVIGALLAICGLVATRQPGLRPHAMHVAALLALVGVLGTASALFQLPALITDASVPRRPAVVARIGMALILLVYLGFSVKSFIDARIKRRA